jgi:hypothetical protein
MNIYFGLVRSGAPLMPEKIVDPAYAFLLSPVS